MMASLDDKLLVAVSQHPVLYNHTRADYKNAEAKTKAWEEIQAELNIDEPIEKIRQRWKSIRDSYVKYLNKTEDRPRVKVRPYKFEKQLKFLKPFLTSKKDEKKDDCFRNDSDDHMYEYAEQTLVTVTTKSEDEQLDFSCNSPNSILTNKRRRNEQNYNNYENHMNIPSPIVNMNSEYRMVSQMDDMELFFFGLAQTMKKLRPLTVAKLKKEISNLVTDAEIRELEEVDHYMVTDS